MDNLKTAAIMVFAIVVTFAPITALWHTAQDDNWVGFIFSLLFPPFGIIYGVLVWLGVL